MRPAPSATFRGLSGGECVAIKIKVRNIRACAL
jgi:hypothetical protein